MIDRRRDLLKFRVELVGILPSIWREILVPAHYSFWDLHVAIQDAMGWLDYHLHEFRFGAAHREDATLIGIPSDEQWDDMPEDCGGHPWLCGAIGVPVRPERSGIRIDRWLDSRELGPGTVQSRQSTFRQSAKKMGAGFSV